MILPSIIAEPMMLCKYRSIHFVFYRNIRRQLNATTILNNSQIYDEGYHDDFDEEVKHVMKRGENNNNYYSQR